MPTRSTRSLHGRPDLCEICRRSRGDELLVENATREAKVGKCFPTFDGKLCNCLHYLPPSWRRRGHANPLFPSVGHSTGRFRRLTGGVQPRRSRLLGVRYGPLFGTEGAGGRTRRQGECSIRTFVRIRTKVTTATAPGPRRSSQTQEFGTAATAEFYSPEASNGASDGARRGPVTPPVPIPISLRVATCGDATG